MTIETIPINTIALDPANARKHNPRNLQAIEGSLRRFGQQKPIVVDSRGVVRAGNGTLAAALNLGWKDIKVVRSDLSAGELTAYAIADNRTAELAEWDLDVLGQLLADEKIGDVGFTDDEVAKLINEPLAGIDDDVTKATASDSDLRDFDAKFEVVVECRDESQQKQIFDRLTGEGLTCRLFTL